MNTEVLLAALVSYVVIVDPVGVALIFQALTKGKGRAYRRQMAIRSVVISVSVVLLFGFFGATLLGRLGISMESFRIAGGLLLFYTAFRMVTRPDAFVHDMESTTSTDVSVFPLTFPLIAGPGCLTLTILLFAEHRYSSSGLVALLVALGLIYGVVFICFMASAMLDRVFGTTANEVLKRLLGVLLAALAIQFIADGIRGIVG
jgi:multiple antibiotic resistance protein